MEQITRLDGVFYYGEIRCSCADDVYRRFRDDYHASLGRAAYRRLGRLGSRKERVHEFGFVFDGPSRKGYCSDTCRLSLELLGLVCGSYCWIATVPQHMTDDEQSEWLDVVLSKGSGLIRKTGKGKGTGRRDRRSSIRYR
jgi:hypothetical protein